MHSDGKMNAGAELEGTPSGGGAPGTVPGGGLRVLVVDDSAVMRKVVIRSARIAGLQMDQVVEAADGTEALDRLRTHGADLVFLDLHMPRMNGEAFLHVLRATPGREELPVVVISSDGQAERVRRTQGLRARFLVKPFSPEELRSLLESVEEVSHALGCGTAPGSGGGTDF
jgi:two-component system chemotaxis response regulator CheY